MTKTLGSAQVFRSVISKEKKKKEQNSLANFLFAFTVKVVIQTVNVVAGLITHAVVEGPPAVCATGPGVHS